MMTSDMTVDDDLETNGLTPKTKINDSADSGVKMELEKDNEQHSSMEKLHEVSVDCSEKDATLGEALLGNGDNQNSFHEPVIITMDKNGKYQTTNKPHMDKSKCRTSSLSCLKKNEYLVLIIGSVTFLFGCIVLVVGVCMMQRKENCQNQPTINSLLINSTPPLQSNLVTSLLDSDVHPTHPNSTDMPLKTMTSQNTQPPITNATEAVLIPGVNIALYRVAYQSSTFVEFNRPYHASLATDGHTDYVFSSRSCSRTAMEERPYWYVDLGSLQVVKTVKIFIPRDVAAGELHNFEVRIGQEEDLSLNPLCRYFMGTALIFRVIIRCERPLYGRYVSVELLGDATRPMNRLTLCEVEVYTN